MPIIAQEVAYVIQLLAEVLGTAAADQALTLRVADLVGQIEQPVAQRFTQADFVAVPSAVVVVAPVIPGIAAVAPAPIARIVHLGRDCRGPRGKTESAEKQTGQEVSTVHLSTPPSSVRSLAG